jgi:hypothetical protein
MKRAIVLLTVTLLGSAAAAEAQFHLSLYGGYALTPNAAPSDALLIGGGVGFSFSRALSLEFSAGRWVLPVSGTAEGLSQGRLTEIPLELEIRAHFSWPGPRFGAYAAAGAGYAFHAFSLDPGVDADWKAAGIDVRESADHGFAAHVGFGFEIALGPAVAFDIGGRYAFLRTGGSWSITDLGSGETGGGRLSGLEFDALAVIAGFRIAFR